MTERAAGDGSPFLEIDAEGLATLTFDDAGKSVNVLTEEVMGRLADRVDRVAREAAGGEVRTLLVRSGKEGSFIAGADVEAIAGIEDPGEAREKVRLGQEIFLSVERLPVPTVAAINGTCLGGGVELALACDYRVAADSDEVRIGLPEVQLGILPAWGGTTRLPRLVGLQDALGMLLSGSRKTARQAEKIGLVDETFAPPVLDEKAAAFARARAEEGDERPAGRKRGLFRRLLEDTAPGRRIVLSQARKRVLSRTGGHYPAPLKILEVVADSAGRSVEKGLELEAAAVSELIVSDVSKNLIHVFHLRERARKGTGVEEDVEPREVERVGVVGAGVMGGGIAQLMAYNEIPVRVKDIDHGPVADALSHARSLFRKAARKRRIPRREAERRMELVSGGIDYAGFGRVDLVVEAVVERLDVKRSVFAEVEEAVPETCVLTTNTSSLSVAEMGTELHRPERLCGMHFFNPVHKMPLVEVVRTGRSSPESVATVYALAKRLGKTPVVTADAPGFLVNRILGPYLNEAGWLLADGVPVEAIDEAATDFGMPMGPLRLIDEIGVDVVRHAGDTLHEAFGERMSPAPPLTALGESDRPGKKGGLGFYRYEDGDEEGVDPDIYRVLGETVPPERRAPEEGEVRARLVVAMVNEAARALEEGVVEDAGDVDLAMVMGTGFPPFRGGLLRYADAAHPRTILAKLEEYEEAHGVRFRPSPLLRTLAEEDRGFYG